LALAFRHQLFATGALCTWTSHCCSVAETIFNLFKEHIPLKLKKINNGGSTLNEDLSTDVAFYPMLILGLPYLQRLKYTGII
jgi:hypothetical protein